MSEVLLTFAPAYLAGALVVLTHVPLGREVLRSGIVFLDLAIAQAAGLGVLLAGFAGAEPHGSTVQIAAAGAALGAAALLSWTERWAGDAQEALIGCLFALTACIGLIALASHPHGGEHLKDLLAGQVLWTTWSDIAPVAALYAGILALWFGAQRRLGRFGFYVLFALAVTASVQLVGIYLVFGTLILPALAALPIARERYSLPFAYGVALSGYAAGFTATTLLDLPAGPTIVCALALCAALGALIARRFRPREA